MTREVYVSMFGPFPDKPTGLAMSVLRRAQAFAKVGTKTVILVDQFSPELDRHISGLNERGHLNDGLIEIRSMHLDLAGRSALPLDAPYSNPSNMGNIGWSFKQDDKLPHVWRGKLNDDYREFVWMRGEKVSFIDYLTNNGKARINRTWFDESGRPFKIEHMDRKNSAVRVEFIDHRGRAYLTRFVTEHNQYSLSTTSETLEFATFEDLRHYWLTNFVFLDNTSPTIISEYAFNRDSLERVPGAHITYTLHNTHFASPYNYGSKLREDQPFLRNLPDLNQVVVLTNEQQTDLRKQFRGISNVRVVPHHAHFEERNVERDPLKTVMVGRFEKVKGHIDAVRAFAKILKTVPDATLDIWGRGSEEDTIQSEIDRLGISDSVKIKGFTTDAATVFASAAATFVPSAYEGFCLSMIEGMAQGCVPIVYNFKYGPADIVTSGRDGFIVERGNIDDLADSAALLLSDSVLCNQMAEQATYVRNRFTESRLVADWRAILPEGTFS